MEKKSLVTLEGGGSFSSLLVEEYQVVKREREYHCCGEEYNEEKRERGSNVIFPMRLRQ